MIALEEHIYVDIIPRTNYLVLAADIGGTNSNFGICTLGFGKIKLLLSLHAKSKDIKDFPAVVDYIIQYVRSYYDIEITKACFAAAGVVSENHNFCKPTNLDFVLDTKQILKRTSLETAIIINDFEAVGYGIDRINAKDLIRVHTGEMRQHANRAIIGAGTGLGKAILHWDAQVRTYMPIPSEGGHADFAAQTQQEFDFVLFIKKLLTIESWPVSWEHVLSGNGISRMYQFLGTCNQYEETQTARAIAERGFHPDEIFKYRQEDQRCRDTFEWYAQLYARCAKNFALETLALGGIYIAGGIAAKNLDMFKRTDFMKEFVNNAKQHELLKKIPVSVVSDYNVSLYGAAAFLLLSRM